MSDPFDRELRAAASREDERRREAASRADEADVAARQYQAWADELAPRFAAEASRRRKRPYRGKQGNKPFLFRRAWQVVVTSHDTDSDNISLRTMSFWVFPDGTWRLNHAGRPYREIRGEHSDAGLTHDEFAASFAREAARDG